MAAPSMNSPIPALPKSWRCKRQANQSPSDRPITMPREGFTMQAISNPSQPAITDDSLGATRADPVLVTTPPILVARGISKRYGKIMAVDNVDVTVYPGEILGIVGESGSGKSTLLRMLNLEEEPDTGHYSLEIPAYQGANLF